MKDSLGNTLKLVEGCCGFPMVHVTSPTGRWIITREGSPRELRALRAAMNSEVRL